MPRVHKVFYVSEYGLEQRLNPAKHVEWSKKYFYPGAIFQRHYSRDLNTVELLNQLLNMLGIEKVLKMFEYRFK